MFVRVSVDALHERKVRVETPDGEESVHKGVEKSLVEIVVDSTSVDTLREKGPQGTPGDLVWRQVGTTLWGGHTVYFSLDLCPQRGIHVAKVNYTPQYNRSRPTYIQYLRDTVQPCVQSVTPHSQVRLVKLVFLGPAEWRIPEPLLDDGVEPGQEEIESGPLVRLLTRMRCRGRGEMRKEEKKRGNKARVGGREGGEREEGREERERENKTKSMTV